MTLALLNTDLDIEREMADATALDLFFERDLLSHSLFEYVKAAWHLVEPSQAFTGNWHVETLCKELQDVYTGKTKRLIVNVPPGTLKSLLVEVFWPTWVWAKNPKKRFLTASYGGHLTMRDNLRARQIIESPWFQARWPVKLQEDQNTKTRYNTTEHGWRIATSVNGQGIGEHPDFIIIDDPHTNQQAQSEAERTAALRWFDGTISVRLGRNPGIIVIMQRLHEDDLSGHLIKRGGWRCVRWPMRFEKCSCPTAPFCDGDEEKRCVYHRADPMGFVADPTDPRTVEGELLFPALFPEEKIRQLELDLGSYGSAGQLQQRPSAVGGGLFKRGWFKFLDAAPALMRVVRGWDTAGTEDAGDYTCGCKIGEEFEWVIVPAAGHKKATRELKSTGRFIVLDMQRDQLGPDGVDKLMLATAQLDQCPVREEREGGASGKSVIGARAKLLKGFDYQEVQLGQNKVVRAKPLRAQAEAGNLYLLRGTWNEAFVKELTEFPTGAHDDQVDAASCAFNSVLLEEPPRKVGITWGT